MPQRTETPPEPSAPQPWWRPTTRAPATLYGVAHRGRCLRLTHRQAAPLLRLGLVEAAGRRARVRD